MLNPNARSFTPGGPTWGNAPAFQPLAAPVTPAEPSFYRYSLGIGSSRHVETESEHITPSSLSILLSKRLVAPAVKGGATLLALQEFATDYFSEVQNAEVTGMTGANPPQGPTTTSGFLISRSLLSLSSPDALNALSSYDGFLLPLQVPSTPDADVASTLMGMWQELFDTFQSDYRVAGMGYVQMHIGERENAQFFHSFWLACTPKSKQLVQLTASVVREKFSLAKNVVACSQVVGYIVSPRAPMVIVLNFNSEGKSLASPDQAEQLRSKNLRVAASYTLSVDADDVHGTVERATDILKAVEEFMCPAKNEEKEASEKKEHSTEVHQNHKEETEGGQPPKQLWSHTMCIELLVKNGTNKKDPVVCTDGSFLPFCATDILLEVQNALLHRNIFIVGSIVDDADAQLATTHSTFDPTTESQIQFAARVFNGPKKQIEKLAAENEDCVFPKKVAAVPYGGAPQAGSPSYQSRLPPPPISSPGVGSLTDYEEIRSLATIAFGTCVLKNSSKPVPLTQKTVNEAISTLTKQQYKVRRDVAGSAVLVVVDSVNRVFLVDNMTGTIAQLPAGAWSNATGQPTVPKCVLEATVVNSFYGERQFRVIATDVLVWNGENVTNESLPQRLQHIDAAVLEDENGWSHATPYGIVVLRAVYSAFSHGNQLLSNVPEHPVKGIVLTPVSASTGPTPPYYSWRVDESTTAVFRVGKTSVLDEKTGAQRAFLKTGDGSPVGQNEFVDFFASMVGQHKSLKEDKDVVQCLLQRTPAQDAHCWDLLRVCCDLSFPIVDSVSNVASILESPMISEDDLNWLFGCHNSLCVKCNIVADDGHISPATKSYWCRKCWVASGCGDCSHCEAKCTEGAYDGESNLFYCESCWTTFSSSRTFTPGAPPPPPDASFTQIVRTRVSALLLDAVAAKFPNTDVLDLCCTDGIARKWMSMGVTKYVGADKSAEGLEETKRQIENSNTANSNVECAANYIHAENVFNLDFWLSELPNFHPHQFHIISCFSGLHNAFKSENSAREFLSAVSSALVPNGLFCGCMMVIHPLLKYGGNFRNSFFSVSWVKKGAPELNGKVGTPPPQTLQPSTPASEGSEDDANPTTVDARIGERFTISLEDEATVMKNVIPLDSFVAMAEEYGLMLVKDACSTFADVLSRDAKWTRNLSDDERAYLSLLMTFGFKKVSDQKVNSVDAPAADAANDTTPKLGAVPSPL